MITIIKHGKKEFTHTCECCGCEFTYEFEDITIGTDSLSLTATSTSVKYIRCPDCGHMCHISNNVPYRPRIGWPTPGEPIPCNTPADTILNPCTGCDFWNKMNQPGFTYVGDTPCTWCSKSPYRIICEADKSIGTDVATLTYTPSVVCNEYTGSTTLNELIKEESTIADSDLNSCYCKTGSSTNIKCHCKE